MRRRRSDDLAAGRAPAAVRRKVHRVGSPEASGLTRTATLPEVRHLGPADVVRLQRLAGNRAVVQLLGKDRPPYASPAGPADVSFGLDRVEPRRHDVDAPGLAKASISKTEGPPGPDANSVLAKPGYNGLTYPERVHFTFSPKSRKVGESSAWWPKVTKVVGEYSLQTVIRSDQRELTEASITEADHCKQVSDLRFGGMGTVWVLPKATLQHELVHKKTLTPLLKQAAKSFVPSVEAVSVPDSGAMTKSDATNAIYASSAFQNAEWFARKDWLDLAMARGAEDHASGRTEKAEQAVHKPWIKKICSEAKKNHWPECSACD